MPSALAWSLESSSESLADNIATTSARAYAKLQEANKGKGFPGFLFDKDNLYPKQQVCLWTCVTCGAPYFYKVREEGKHAGPIWRIENHPEWSPIEGACWRGRAYKVKCTTPKGVTVLVHEGYDPPDEATISRFTASARAQRRRYKEAVYDVDQERAIVFWCP